MEQRAMSFANWAHVGVVVSPAVEGGRIDTRFVVWGLSCGVVHMIHLERFQKVRFALFCMYGLFLFFFFCGSRCGSRCGLT